MDRGRLALSGNGYGLIFTHVSGLGVITPILVIEALKMALWHRGMPRGVIVHSDCGSQYCSKDYQKLLDGHQLICSMSKRGDCFDNAAMES